MQSKPQLFQNILPFPVRAWTSIEDPQFEPQPQRTSVGFQRKVCKEGGVKPIASSNLPPSNLSHTLQTYHLHIFPPSNLFTTFKPSTFKPSIVHSQNFGGNGLRLPWQRLSWRSGPCQTWPPGRQGNWTGVVTTCVFLCFLCFL